MKIRNLNIKSSSGKLIAENWSDLLDGSIYMSFQSAGVALDGWWSFSNNDGLFIGTSIEGSYLQPRNDLNKVIHKKELSPDEIIKYKNFASYY